LRSGPCARLNGSVANPEVGAAASIDPETALVDAPGIAADTGRAADLASELDVAGGADSAPVSAAVIGGAGDLRSVAGLRVCAWGYSEGGPENKDRDQERLRCACHLASFRDEDYRWNRA